MKLKNEPESKHYADDTGSWLHTKQGQNLLSHMLLQEDVSGGPPGGYEKWLHGALNQLRPEDVYLMKAHGLSMEDAMRVRRLKEGAYHGGDPDMVPYSDDYANALVNQIKRGRR